MLTLNYRDTKPIYIQIKSGLKKLMITGAIAADEKLPSVRELAGTLAINPNTIQRDTCIPCPEKEPLRLRISG